MYGIGRCRSRAHDDGSGPGRRPTGYTDRPRTLPPDGGSGVSDRPASSTPRWFVLAYLTGGFGLALNAMMNFLLPLRAAELGIGIGTIGLLLGAKAATEALTSVPVGGLIDKIGPRRSFVVGTAVSTVLLACYAFVGSAVWLFALQVGLGVMRPMAWVGSQTYVSGLRSGADRARDTGRLSFVATAAQIVGPLLVGFGSQAFGTGRAYLVFSAYCGAYVLVGLLLPRSSGAGSGVGTRRRGFVDGLRLLRNPGMRVVIFLSSGRLWISGAWAAFFPLLLVTRGVPEGAAGTVVSAMAVVGTVVSPLSGRLAARFRVASLTAFSLLSGAAGVVLAPALASFPAAFGSAFLVGIGHGISLPMLLVLVSRAVPDDQRGLALGVRSSANQTASAVAPPLIGAVIGSTTAAIGFPLAGILGTCLIAAAWVTGRRHPGQRAGG